MYLSHKINATKQKVVTQRDKEKINHSLQLTETSEGQEKRWICA